MMHRTENDISAVSPGGIVPGLFLQVEQKAGEIAITKKSEQLSLLASLRKGRDYDPILAIFLPPIYVLHTANNTHSR